MGLVELIVTVCALSLPGQCEDQHLSFPANVSLHQCVMNAQPYIAQWINEHPKWVAVRCLKVDPRSHHPSPGVVTHGHAPTREAAMAAFAKS
jgi:hypothetical protein